MAFKSKCNIFINGFREWVWFLEYHPNFFAHIVKVNLFTININAVIENLPFHPTTINFVIHAV
ncbi:octanoyltransferase [Listeria ivanovii FSL F6-596]|nr:octanoyltransferase [Listeria ivanovii FSL F6-596]